MAQERKDIIIEWAKELQSIAQAGLWYGKDDFDIERYQRIRDIAANMLSVRCGMPQQTVTALFCNEEGYQTPKIDTRAAIFREDKILLVQERDGRWSIPGGWCDYNLSPAENTIKEVKEEAGLEAEIIKVIAVLDREKHNMPAYVYGIVQIYYLCEIAGGQFETNIETINSGYFSQDDLPPLAGEKCTAEEIAMCFQAYKDPTWKVLFD